MITAKKSSHITEAAPSFDANLAYSRRNLKDLLSLVYQLVRPSSRGPKLAINNGTVSLNKMESPVS